MKNLNKTVIIGIDHGYGNIKTANTVTPTGVIPYDSEPTFAGNILKFNSLYYRIGEGHKPFVTDKSADNDYYLLTLAAIARELNQIGETTSDVHIAAGLPLTWVRTQRESFRKYLLQNERVRFAFRNKEYNIRFVGCSIFPQGYPAIISKLGNMDGVNMLADIGNGTMNIMYITNKRPVESQCWTEKLGVNQCVIAAKSSLMDKFGIKVEDVIIENVIRYGKENIGANYLDCIITAAKSYAEEIFVTLRKYEYNSDLMRLYVVGGGGCIIKHFADYDKDRVIIINDICATAKGYEQFAYSMLKKKVGEGNG